MLLEGTLTIFARGERKGRKAGREGVGKEGEGRRDAETGGRGRKVVLLW